MKILILFFLFISKVCFANNCEEYNKYESDLEKKSFLLGTVQKLAPEIQFKAVNIYFKALTELCVKGNEKALLSIARHIRFQAEVLEGSR